MSLVMRIFYAQNPVFNFNKTFLKLDSSITKSMRIISEKLPKVFRCVYDSHRRWKNMKNC